jgi:methyl-accepting chemotaxis protein
LLRKKASGDVVSALTSIRRAIEHVNEVAASAVEAVEKQSTVTGDMSSNMRRAAAKLVAQYERQFVVLRREVAGGD